MVRSGVGVPAHLPAAAVVAIFLVAACGSPGFYAPPVGGAGAPSPSGAPTSQTPTTQAPTATAWEKVTAGIRRDGSVPLETALAAFSLAVGPLPGVEVPAGEVGFIGSGSGAIRWLLGHWNELTPAQRAEAQRLLEPTATAVATGQRIAAAGGPLGQPRPGHDDFAPIESFQAEAKTQEANIAAKLGRQMKVPINLVASNFVVKEGTVEYARTSPLGAGGKLNAGEMTRCQIEVGPRGRQLESVDLSALVAHEVFHCFQYSLVYKHVEESARVGTWLAEGSGAWVGEDAVSAFGGSMIAGQYWGGWLRAPEGSLFSRVWDALGFFAHLKESGVDPWPLMDLMHRQGATSSEQAYDVAAAAPGADAFIDQWGPSYFRETPAPDWSMEISSTASAITSPRLMATLSDGERLPVGVDPLAGQPIELEISADVVVFGSLTGRGLIRFSDGTQFPIADILNEPFCTKPGGCTCPSDSNGADHQFRSTPKGRTMIGLSGHIDGIEIMLIDGMTADTACAQAPEDFVPQGPCYCAPGPGGRIEAPPRVEAARVAMTRNVP